MSMIIDGTNGLTFNNATTQASAGQVLQVVQATTTSSATTSSSSFVTTGFSASITPKFATSKILIIHNAAVNQQTSGGGQGALTVARNGTALGSAGGLAQVYCSSTNVISSIGFTYLDSPSTTSSITYAIYFASANTAATITHNSGTGIGVSTTSITLMEIAG
jgi:hypothetical protein